MGSAVACQANSLKSIRVKSRLADQDLSKISVKAFLIKLCLLDLLLQS